MQVMAPTMSARKLIIEVIMYHANKLNTGEQKKMKCAD